MTTMTTKIYSSDFPDISVDNIAKKLGIADADADTREIAVEALDLCESAYHWGLEGIWPDQNFNSDSNWKDAYGESILRLELRLDEELASHDDGPILEMFRIAHARGLEHFQATEI
jgi:hypothetical protein